MPTEQPPESVQPHKDLIGLLLAACDDRHAFDAVLKTVTMGELPALFLAVCDIVGSLLMWTDRGRDDGDIPERLTVRSLLVALRAALEEGSTCPGE